MARLGDDWLDRDLLSIGGYSEESAAGSLPLMPASDKHSAGLLTLRFALSAGSLVPTKRAVHILAAAMPYCSEPHAAATISPDNRLEHANRRLPAPVAVEGRRAFGTPFALNFFLEVIALNREDRASEAPFPVLPGFLLEVSDACSLRPVGHAATGCPFVVLLALAGRRCDGFLTATSPPLPDPADCE